MTKLVRWKCPSCGGGVNAPSRPRKDDVRRYCLACSAQTGRLVERVAPALEKKREVRSAKMATKRKTKEQREKAKETAYYTVAGLDLRKEMKRLCKLKAFGGPKGAMVRRTPKLEVGRRSEKPGRLGVAYPWKNSIRIVDYPGIDQADVKETLLHELVHIYEGTSEGRWHGEAFNRRMRDAFREAYSVTPKGAQRNCYHGRYARALREEADTQT